MSTNGQPTKLLDNSFKASQIAYDSEQGVPVHTPGWKQVPYPESSARGKLLKIAEAVELVAPNGQHFVAFAGSREPTPPGKAGWDDWIENNKANGDGKMAPKYEAAAALGKLYKDENVVFTGHSLGGGLSKTAAEAQTMTGKHQGLSVSFDPAPIGSREVLGQFGASNPLRLKCNSIAVVANTDTLHHTLGTGVVQGVTPEVANYGLAVNEKVLMAKSEGEIADFSGHSITAIKESDHHPDRLTPGLMDKDNRLVQKDAFDIYAEAHAKTFDTRAVNHVLDSARTPARGQELGNAR